MNDSPWRHERRTIECCFGCKPPKRYPGCGAKCKEYKEQKAKLTALRQKEREDKMNHPPLTIHDFNKL